MDAKSLLYTSSHEWIEPEGDVLKIGISDHAQHMLGDIVFVEMPEPGKRVAAGDELLTIESPKAAASVYAPVSGEVVEVNGDLESSPDIVNRSPTEDGWIVKIRPSDFAAEKSALLAWDAYSRHLEEE